MILGPGRWKDGQIPQRHFQLYVGPGKLHHCFDPLLASGLYYKTITIVTMTIVGDATIWSVTYDRN
jgi:hypothetical protein